MAGGGRSALTVSKIQHNPGRSILNLKTEILAILAAAEEPIDRAAIVAKCSSGDADQISDQLYLMRKAGLIAGDKEKGRYLYQLPAHAGTETPPGVEKTVNEPEPIATATEPGEPMGSTQQEEVSQEQEREPAPTAEEEEKPSSGPLDDRILVYELQPDADPEMFCAWVSSKGRMALTRGEAYKAGEIFELSKDEFAETVEFARSVGWLAAP
jgi:hypothetical protein